MKCLSLIILSAAIMVPLDAKETCDSGHCPETVESHLRKTVRPICKEEIEKDQTIKQLSETVDDLKLQVQVNKNEIIKLSLPKFLKLFIV